MEKTIEIPEGYEAQIEGNKVILEPKESEDERIRKEMLNSLKEAEDCIVFTPFKKKSWIAYLERQKEQKPVNDRYMEGYMDGYAKGHKDAENSYNRAVSYHLDTNVINDAPIIDESMEDKDAKEPTPKQDYSGLTDLERAIHRGFLCAGVENVPVGIIRDTAQDCLAQIKPAEWSEVDKIHLMNAICAAEKKWGIDSCTANWLKSLRPSWKPSEEQIDDLQMLLDDLNNLDNKNNVKMIKVFHWSENYKNLKELLDNLKKQ